MSNDLRLVKLLYRLAKQFISLVEEEFNLPRWRKSDTD